MRLAINSGGLDSFFNGISSFINTAVNTTNSYSLIKSFQTVADKTNNINGGVGTLGTALGYIQTCKVAEETRKTAVLAIKMKTDNFMKTAVRVDAEVAAAVSTSQEAFYKTNPWLRPPAKPFNLFDPSTWNGKSLQRSWDDFKTTAKKAWDGVVKFVKSPVGKIIIGTAIIAALAIATVCTGGATAGVAGFILAGALKGAAIGAVSGAAIGTVTSAVGHKMSTGSWDGVGNAMINGAASGFLSGAITGGIFGAAGNALKVMSAAKAWNQGSFESGFKSMKYHYSKHVLKEGFSNGNNVVKYTKDALGFAERNNSLLKLTYNHKYNNTTWFFKYIGQGGNFDKLGKIVNFWYVGK